MLGIPAMERRSSQLDLGFEAFEFGPTASCYHRRRRDARMRYWGRFYHCSVLVRAGFLYQPRAPRKSGLKLYSSREVF
jgi:hypothetical protein